ncbi:alpha/beta hydrolase [Nocardioides sp. GY 10113]|uniref:alpha/beta hydrolase n=1 Tax=Nocardioides sp. GY 10113 TaxID=2569761 RepID=UPI001F0F952D|nr:alpha/beta hydrolase [Nocardioides sp. GY 10113]
MTLRTRFEAASLRALLALPAPLLRAVAGPPLRLDGQTLAPDTQLTLRLQRLLRMPGAETLPIAEGRLAMREHTALVRGHQPVGAVEHLTVAGLPARRYLPTGYAEAPGPLLLFFHGGGFLYGDLETHDAPCRVLAERSGVPVLAVEYRLAPEAPFPAAFDDAEAAYAWVLDHAAEIDVDPGRLAVGGDSAGGNLAAWVAVCAARRRTPLAFQLLVYPVACTDHDTESYRLFNRDLYLTDEFMRLATETFLPTDLDRKDERVNLRYADLPARLAPAYVATAGFDPLRDEGEDYADRLASAGARVECRRFDDQIHGFLNIVGAGRTSPAAVAEIADRLREALRP